MSFFREIFPSTVMKSTVAGTLIFSGISGAIIAVERSLPFSSDEFVQSMDMHIDRQKMFSWDFYLQESQAYINELMRADFDPGTHTYTVAVEYNNNVTPYGFSVNRKGIEKYLLTPDEETLQSVLEKMKHLDTANITGISIERVSEGYQLSPSELSLFNISLSEGDILTCAIATKIYREKSSNGDGMQYAIPILRCDLTNSERYEFMPYSLWDGKTIKYDAGTKETWTQLNGKEFIAGNIINPERLSALMNYIRGRVE